MKITFILTHANMAGGVRVVATYARVLMERGHEVLVVSTPPPPHSIRRKVSTFLHGRGWPSMTPIGPSHLDNAGVPHLKLAKFRPVTDADLPDADVVVATWWETAEWVARLSPSKGAKCYFIQHYETWGGEPARVDATWRLPMKKIVISRWLADIARDKFGDSDFALIPNSVDRKQFDAPPRGKQAEPTVGFMYSTTWFKGCDISFAALESVAKEIPNLKLLAFGAERESPELKMPAGVKFTQNPPQNQIKDIYASCDLWLMGSRSEGFGLPMLEAFACRTPVVSTKVGGPLDMIEDGKNGYLVDVDDSAGLALRMSQILRLSDAQWREMSDAAYATVCRYSWQDATALLEQSFESAIFRGSSQQRMGA